MLESDFLKSIYLSIKASEPVIWIETPDDDWIIEAIKRELAGVKLPCEVGENPDFTTLEKVSARTVFLWINASANDFTAHERSLIRIARRMRSLLTIVIFAHPCDIKPQLLADFPAFVAPLPSFEARKSLISITIGSYANQPGRLDQLAFASAGLT
ncbi:MAG: hypothetical protein J6A01_01735, partial [Proteobacteria bacterium]|nr:hypothetical protein [Pseudomonadota bacterium]